jgi:queuosine precursor transporter
MLLIVLYLAAIIAANLSVAAFGPGVAVLNAALFIGLDLSARDRLHEQWRGRGLWWKMAALIAAGSVLSWLLNTGAGRIALASFAAFAAAGVADTLMYRALGSRAYLVKVNGSNVVSAVVDSLVFGALAFSLPLLWPVVLGQIAAKVAGGVLWSLVLRPFRSGAARKAVPSGM